jgi:UDP-glucose 4-epimerase
MNILITGGTGFLGSSLARELSSHNIKIIARGKSRSYLAKFELEKFKFESCDILKKSMLKKTLSSDLDLVIHCAAKVDIRNDGRCPGGLIETNVTATINLMEAMVTLGIKKLLFASSMTVYGTKNRIPVEENGNSLPVNFYGNTKKWAEEAIASYARKDLIKALIVRYPGLYGYPRRGGYVYGVAKKMLKGEDITINTKGLKFWETLNIRDAVFLTKKIIDNWEWKKNIDILNCSYGEETDIIKTAFMLKRLFHSKSSIAINKPVDYKRFYLNNRKLRKIIDADRTYFNSLKAFVNRHKHWLSE